MEKVNSIHSLKERIVNTMPPLNTIIVYRLILSSVPIFQVKKKKLNQRQNQTTCT